METGPHRAPLLQHRDELSLRDAGANQVLRQIGQLEAGLGRFDDVVGVVEGDYGPATLGWALHYR
jgi:hypothetical protein